MGEQSYIYLTKKDNHKKIVIKGRIPGIEDFKFKTTLFLKIDGKIVMEKELGIGDYEINELVSSINGKKKVELLFSDIQVLPGNDKRIASTRIFEIGFE